MSPSASIEKIPTSLTGPEAVLDRPQEPDSPFGLLEIEDRIDHVLDDLGTRNRALLGNTLSRQEEGGLMLPAPVGDLVAAVFYLVDRPRYRAEFLGVQASESSR